MAAEPLQTKFVERAIRDVAPTVRTAVLLALDRRQDASTCGYASLVLRNPDPHVALTAIDVAGRACAGNSAAIASLGALATRLPPPELPDVSTPATESPRDTRAGFTFGPAFRGSRRLRGSRRRTRWSPSPVLRRTRCPSAWREW